MINIKCLRSQWTDNFKKKKKYSKIDPSLLNKMIHALFLLELLQSSGLNFVFKGGTALILLLKKSQRFSIDVDITTEESRAALEKVIGSIVHGGTFISYEYDERRSVIMGIPKAHYKFYYKSDYQTEPVSIILDVLFEKNKYAKIIEVPIAAIWLENTGEPTMVKVPAIDAIMGDKMTAFAPTTIGIQYGQSKDLQIIKQLFDLGKLFNSFSDLNIVYATFTAIALAEMKYRTKTISVNDALDDIIKAGFLIAKRGISKDANEKTQYDELASGLLKIKSFLISENFRIDEAIEASAKISYLAARFKKKDFSKIEYYSKKANALIPLIESKEYSFLNKLRKLPNEAFYYWTKTIELISQ